MECIHRRGFAGAETGLRHLQVLGALHAIHSLCVFFHLLSPRLNVATGALSGTTSIILLNSMNLAVACRYLHACCLMVPSMFANVAALLSIMGQQFNRRLSAPARRKLFMAVYAWPRSP